MRWQDDCGHRHHDPKLAAELLAAAREVIAKQKRPRNPMADDTTVVRFAHRGY